MLIIRNGSRSLAAVLLCLVTLPAFADLHHLGGGGTIGDLLDEVHAVKNAPGVGARVVDSDRTAYAFIIPVAGNAAGSLGTYFRSDVTIANRRQTPQVVAVGFIKRGINNSSSPVQYFTIPANNTTVTRDFIGTAMNDSGIGTILVVAMTAAGSGGAVDNSGQIDGFSRIWTPQPGSSGSVSQSFEAIRFDETAINRWAYGIRQDAGFRTNVGIVNLGSVAVTFNVQVTGTGGSASFTQAVRAVSMEQVPIPSGNFNDGFLFIIGATDITWSAYGTSVDNVTGDGWVSHAH